MRISDWSSDVCSSDLLDHRADDRRLVAGAIERLLDRDDVGIGRRLPQKGENDVETLIGMVDEDVLRADRRETVATMFADAFGETRRSEEHTSELQSLMRISYAVFCLKKKTTNQDHNTNI